MSKVELDILDADLVPKLNKIEEELLQVCLHIESQHSKRPGKESIDVVKQYGERLSLVLDLLDHTGRVLKVLRKDETQADKWNKASLIFKTIEHLKEKGND